jgi:nucleoid-associated protein YejK
LELHERYKQKEEAYEAEEKESQFSHELRIHKAS